MAPRSERRVGMSRMDAALDAVSQMGYPRELVRAKMIDLLKEYGGEVGYPFIEADAYKVLIDAILEDEEKASMKTPNTGGSSTSIESSCSQTPNSAQIDGGGGNRWKDIVLDNTLRSPENVTPDSTDRYTPIPPGGYPPSPPPLIATSSPPPPPPPPPQSIPARRRNPCYGYIDGDDDEEETEFVILTPMPPAGLFEQPMESLSSERVRRSNRRSRWDVRPEDM